MKFGIYRLNYLLNSIALIDLKEEYGAEVSFLSFYRAWNHCNIENDLSWLNWVLSSPSDVLLTWEPWLIPPAHHAPEIQPDFSLKNITSGMYDTYIRAFASILAAFQRTIFLRPMHEMNGCWYPWCGTVNQNTPDDFINAWRHIKKLFVEADASNIKWVWSPYTSSYPDNSENGICSYFPGDNQIDMIALDGYNWGTLNESGAWQSFLELFGKGYDIVTSLSTKPVIIGEVGCTEFGGEKSKWINNMFLILSSKFSRIQILIWFDIDKECDWRIASSDSALDTFKKNAKIYFK
ncbi:glycoside hydrolase family 26 protein [Geobacter sp. AOG2]|uniref:glycoside hydrolase family 26 protein n=1 Tax=Geobacter sp. AOG2 TaxID=1566347 RepID=UPI001CC4CA96|nr:glycosyl hydrolase [Geobacter sp. AOG2]GFE61248.1 hypothetical protein AOG2_18350 [Geobacter sp. AOG2]